MCLLAVMCSEVELHSKYGLLLYIIVNMSNQSNVKRRGEEEGGKSAH